MKKVLVPFIALCVIAMSFTLVETDKTKATVDQMDGLYVFIKSKPVAEYEYLGSVSKAIAWSGKPEEMLNSMIKKVKKEYPKADGIVFTSVDMDKADAIQFKPAQQQ
jgi:hypothetical protein